MKISKIIIIQNGNHNHIYTNEHKHTQDDHENNLILNK